jgi:hypothetical protein
VENPVMTRDLFDIIWLTGILVTIAFTCVWLTATRAEANPYKEGVRDYYSGLCFRARPYVLESPEKNVLWERGWRDAQRRGFKRDDSICFPGREK